MRLFGAGDFLGDLEYHASWVIQQQQCRKILQKLSAELKEKTKFGGTGPRALNKLIKELNFKIQSLQGSIDFTWRRSFYPNFDEVK